jgi:predicted nucleic-acid-binding Zn-ribbon protein
MRQSHICPKCHHNHVLLIDKIPDTGEYSTELRELHIATIFVGTSWLGDDKFDRAGKLKACVCRRCGFTELYASMPDQIPIDGLGVREAIGAEPSPYR